MQHRENGERAALRSELVLLPVVQMRARFVATQVPPGEFVHKERSNPGLRTFCLCLLQMAQRHLVLRQRQSNHESAEDEMSLIPAGPVQCDGSTLQQLG
jgi:hypothetical protein